MIQPVEAGATSASETAGAAAAAAAVAIAAMAAWATEDAGGQEEGEAEHDSEDDEEAGSFMDRVARAHSEAVSHNLSTGPDDPDWQGHNMSKRGPTVGLRVGLQNVDKKLHGDTRAREAFIRTMRTHRMDIGIAFEPGRGSETNLTALRNVAVRHQSKVVTTTRGQRTNCGGIVIWIDTKWAQVQHQVYRMSDDELQDRVIAVEFDNGAQGDHNKTLLIAYYGLNSAHTGQAKTHRVKIHRWIAMQIQKFRRANPHATVVLAGDINAAKHSNTDTDREVWDQMAGQGEREQDAEVIDDLEAMHLHDVIREKAPYTRVVTRKNVKETHRYLDRVMATIEAAAHVDTRAGASSNLDMIDTARSPDHKLVIADLPIDTAGAALLSTGLWEAHTEVKWVKDQDDMGVVSAAARAEFRARLASGPEGDSYADTQRYYLGAAKGTTLKKVTTRYPLKVNQIKHMKKLDYRLRARLRPLRTAAYQIDKEGRHPEAAMHRVVNLRPLEGTPLDEAAVAALRTLVKGQAGKAEVSEALWERIKAAEAHLSRKKRNERQKEMRTHTKRRNDRFDHADKKMLGRVIASIMKRMTTNEEVTSLATPTGHVSEATRVAKGVVAFYQNWFKQESTALHRWKTEEDMMTLNTANLLDPEYRDFVEMAYRRSYDKYNALQDEDGIWDRCLARITMEELLDAIKSTKTNSAGGPSGLTYDILRDVEEEHLGPLLATLQQCLATGKVPAEMNRSKLKPIPKTDKGLSDLGKTRPIALMEVTLKLYEKILFKRIGTVLKENRMLRGDQYGSLPGRTVADPIRALAECVEDAMVTGKELHVFSADLSRAFDSIEYWSQAMSWRSLGIPRRLVDTLIDMDEGGTTEVVLGQGRTTSSVLGQTGWFKSGRGVRQGSIGGPIKWVVFMNFWLELVHARHKGEGYRMACAEGEDELLGQMFVDDSTWLTSSTQAMTRVIASCQTFVEFHTLSFNRAKCEYMAINQRTPQRGEGPRNPVWPDGTIVGAKIRKPTDWTRWNAERAALEERLAQTEDAALYSEGRRVVKQPSPEDYAAIRSRLRALQGAEGSPGYPGARAEAIAVLERTLEDTYRGEIDPAEVRAETAAIMGQWEDDRVQLGPYEKAGEGETMRYLGVHFQPREGWGAQRKILETKFRKLTDSIRSSSPTRQQAVYCVNAVINATLKFPLQVAGIPRSTLERWDTANRAVIRKAGKLPMLPPWMFHAPKDQGGLGLESLVEAVGRTQAGHQMRLLNSDSTPGRIVRAARKRNELLTDPKWSIQARIADYLGEQGMRIEEATRTDIFGNVTRSYVTDTEQEDLDRERAHAAPRGTRRKTWWAYGDGATYLEEQRAGWGVCISASPMCGGEYDAHARGRLDADQNNSAAEAMAMLQAMLLVHPSHHLVIHTDNQGCVDKAQRIEEADVTSWNHRPIWRRIKAMVAYRGMCGATTTVNWIHSHVDEEERRATPKAAHLCVCKTARELECDPLHWAHVGNDAADTLAKEGASMPRTDDWRERARGSPGFVIRKASEVAQGPCTEWIKAHRTPHYATTAGWAEACEASSPPLRKAIIKTLDAPGGASWRFWARMVAGVLPTMSRLAKITNNSGPLSQYNRVYQGALGPLGRCISHGCDHDKETTKHAIVECAGASLAWGKLSEDVDGQWGVEDRWRRGPPPRRRGGRPTG